MKFVHPLGECTADLIDLVGSKAAGIGAMIRSGFPVPDGFVITTTACRRYLRTGDLPDGAWDEVAGAFRSLLANAAADGRPALVTVRPGAAIPMSRIMDTITHVGVNQPTMDHLAAWGSPEFATRIRLQFLNSFAVSVRRVPPDRVAQCMSELQEGAGERELLAVADQLEAMVVDETQRAIPADPLSQLREAVEAAFGSWDSRKARDHRRRHDISDDIGTAAVVQLSVFGSLDDGSGSGVAYSRDPLTGVAGVTGRFVPSSHGIDLATGYGDLAGLDTVAASFPEAQVRLTEALAELERRERDAARIDFTIERGRLWLLMDRIADRSSQAFVRTAIEMEAEGLISRGEAVLRVEPQSLDELLHPRLAHPGGREPIATGVGASPGAATGALVFDAAAALAAVAEGTRVILARLETSPGDLAALEAAEGIVTSHGGRTSHAAVIARGMGKPAVTGIPGIDIDEERGLIRVGHVELVAGDLVTIDGATGRVFVGSMDIEDAGSAWGLDTLLSWADEFRRLEVWANADTPADAARALVAGAEGIGLARTEYMFLGDRLEVVRAMILAEDTRTREDALERLESLQIGDFERLLETMESRPVVVRLLDPPLHEFLPGRRDVEHALRQQQAAGLPTGDLERLEAAVSRWEEANPMLGLRGVRLAVVIPEIYRTQVLAALEAVRRRLDAGGDPRLGIMVPLVGSAEELHLIREMIQEEVHYAGRQLEVTIGTMIELPRAALIADQIATESDFFSFGTNDLTQTTLGLSRDDAEEAFLRTYVEQGILANDPFETIDPDGVGRLISMAVMAGRAVNPELEIGICGEHGADPRSIAFFHDIGLDYVSCSPPRIPVARLAAAQAALRASGV